MVDATQVVGYIGAVFLTITLFPQLYYTYKLKNADSISIYFLLLQIKTCSLFLTYGILLRELPLILANTLVLLQSFILFLLKIHYSRKKDDINIP